MKEIGGVVCSQRRYQQVVLDQEIDVFEVPGHSNYRSCEWIAVNYKSRTSVGIIFEDEVRALLPLGSLTGTWEIFKVTACNLAPNGVVTWNLVKINVLNEESRKISDKDSSSSHSEVFVTQSHGRSKSRCPGKDEGRSWSKLKDKYVDFVCYHENGHINWQCEQWKKDKKQSEK
jgi:hypothetical protein